jgi:hypothetical protein
LITGEGDWRCERTGNTVDPGPMVFYTRLESPTDTEVQHRWYQFDRLRQAGTLQIGANSTGGYRTYSRRTVETGEWRVELLSRDGTLLHEERFVVR